MFNIQKGYTKILINNFAIAFYDFIGIWTIFGNRMGLLGLLSTYLKRKKHNLKKKQQRTKNAYFLSLRIVIWHINLNGCYIVCSQFLIN